MLVKMDAYYLFDLLVFGPNDISYKQGAWWRMRSQVQSHMVLWLVFAYKRKYIVSLL